MLAKRLIIFIITTLVGYSASAQLIFTPERFDFGTLEEMGGKRSCTFRATNQGKKPVVLVDIVTTCGCTVPTFSRKPILPNQSTEIIVTYDTHAENGSMYNTPNCWAIYCCGKVFKYLKSIGGLEAMEQRNIAAVWSAGRCVVSR